MIMVFRDKFSDIPGQSGFCTQNGGCLNPPHGRLYHNFVNIQIHIFIVEYVYPKMRSLVAGLYQHAMFL